MFTYLQTLFLWYPDIICRGLIMTAIFLFIIYCVSESMTKPKHKIRLSQNWKSRLVLSIYLSIVFMLTIALRQPFDSFKVILIPFNSYANVLNHGYIAMENIVENIIMLIPFGIIFPITSIKKNVTYVLRCGLCISFFIEVLQLITKRGCFEVDDIINNFIGVALGYALYHYNVKKVL